AGARQDRFRGGEPIRRGTRDATLRPVETRGAEAPGLTPATTSLQPAGGSPVPLRLGITIDDLNVLAYRARGILRRAGLRGDVIERRTLRLAIPPGQLTGLA